MHLLEPYTLKVDSRETLLSSMYTSAIGSQTFGGQTYTSIQAALKTAIGWTMYNLEV